MDISTLFIVVGLLGVMAGACATQLVNDRIVIGLRKEIDTRGQIIADLLRNQIDTHAADATFRDYFDTVDREPAPVVIDNMVPAGCTCFPVAGGTHLSQCPAAPVRDNVVSLPGYDCIELDCL